MHRRVVGVVLERRIAFALQERSVRAVLLRHVRQLVREESVTGQRSRAVFALCERDVAADGERARLQP